jgi:hypothetical protein
MSQRTQLDGGWTTRSVLLAAGSAIITMMIALQLSAWHLWLQDEGWSVVFIPAIVGSIVLAIRHPGHKLLTTMLFFPVLAAMMFLAGACLPLGPTH